MGTVADPAPTEPPAADAPGDGTEPVEPALADGERAELEALRTEVAALRARLDAAHSTSGATGEGASPAAPGAGPGAASGGPGTAARPRRWSLAWRTVGAVVAFVLMAGCAVSAVIAGYARSQVLDTDRYVSIVGPIGSDPAVRAQITDTTTQAIVDQLDLEDLAEQALGAVGDAAENLPPAITNNLTELAPVIAGAGEDLVRRAVTEVVNSPEFEELWVAANRAAHNNLVAVVTGRDEGSTALTADENGQVTMSLAPIVEKVKTRLTAQGLDIAARIPEVDAQFVLFQSDQVVRAQRAVDLLDKAATALPWFALAFGVAGVLLVGAGRRRRATIVAGLVLAATMVVLGLTVNVARSLYLAAVPSQVLSHSAAVALFDPIAEPLRWTLRAVLVLGLVIALAAFLTGRSRPAQALKGWVAALTARGRGTRAASPVERWIAQHRVALMLLALGIGGTVLVVWDYPTGAVVGWVAAAVALVVLAVALVGGQPGLVGNPDEPGDNPRRL